VAALRARAVELGKEKDLQAADFNKLFEDSLTQATKTDELKDVFDAEAKELKELEEAIVKIEESMAVSELHVAREKREDSAAE
jgi:hypothetical protein